MTNIVVNPFVQRQTPYSEYSHWSGTWESLVGLIAANWDSRTPGDRPNVLLVHLPPEGFYTGLVRLCEGVKLTGEYRARRPGELPVKEIRAEGQKVPAYQVYVVLYHSSILGDDATAEDAWEIISINASPDEREAPITPGALMRNFFDEPGGTQGGMTAEEFVVQLKISREYWRDYCLVMPKPPG